jgi:hypothetical protein
MRSAVASRGQVSNKPKQEQSLADGGSPTVHFWFMNSTSADCCGVVQLCGRSFIWPRGWSPSVKDWRLLMPRFLRVVIKRFAH